MPDRTQVVVAGHLCLDIIPDLSQASVDPAAFYVPGSLVEVGPAALCTGGAVSNTGLALRKLGIPTVLMGKIGDDPFGTLVRSLLERWEAGAGDGLIVVPGETTSYTVALNPRGLDRMFLHDPAANNTFCAADVRYDVVARARLFHLGYPPVLSRLYRDNGRELVDIYRRVKELGITTSLDMSLPDPNAPSGQADWQAILGAVMPYVDLFLPSAEEMLYMLDRPRFDDYRENRPGDILSLLSGDDLSRLGHRLVEMGGAIVGIKCGERGFYLRTAGEARLRETGAARPGAISAWAGREAWQPTFHVTDYAGSTGAGDATIAGFLAAYLRAHSLEQCLAYSCAVGAFNVTALDALSGLRSWDQTVTAVEAGWEQNPLEVAGDGWSRGRGGLWLGPRDSSR